VEESPMMIYDALGRQGSSGAEGLHSGGLRHFLATLAGAAQFGTAGELG